MATKEESPVLQRQDSTGEEHTSPKKRRKVNHACVYCRRSHMTCDLDRPCQRCVKRSIGHLCHDKPRESARGQKAEKEKEKEDGDHEALLRQKVLQTGILAQPLDQQHGEQAFMHGAVGQIPSTASMQQSLATQPLRPVSSAAQVGGYGGDNQHFVGYGDWNMGSQSHFNDMSYMFNAPDITDEYNMLNNFLTSSLLDDSAMFPIEGSQGLNPENSLNNAPSASTNGPAPIALPQQKQDETKRPSYQSPTIGNSIIRPRSARPDKDDEKLYMTIADPSGNDTPQERMKKLLEAKYSAGLLKPFNYVQGYARLGNYMESHLQPASRHRILRQLDKFRPKFRERMQKLTDMQLMLVEMWFERTLMEYDRVFASMAIPACAWRRTGEIFRGNKEMAELIHVPIDKLRDGKIALHEIITETDLVNYWDSFLAIAFDNSQKAMLTTCHLKNPDDKAPDPEIKCCFSFTIRRDSQHNINFARNLFVGVPLPDSVRVGPRQRHQQTINNSCCYAHVIIMDPPPDVDRIADAIAESSRGLANASQEMRHLKNLPSYDNSQGVLNALNRLTTAVESLRTEVNTLRTDVNTLRTDVNTLRTDFNHRFDNIDLRLRANLHNQVAQIYNSHISNSNTPLRGLHNHLNMAVNGFPVDSAALKRLQGPALTTLLEAFQLPSDGTVAVKRQRFREFVGLVVDV